MSKLTDKQEMFCKEYLIDLNATQAAIRAGYSERTANEQGCQNLAKLNIQERIAELKAGREERLQINADWVLNQAVKVHQRCMQAEMVTDREGNPVMVEDANGQLVAAYKFEHAGANKALELIGKHVNVQAFKDKVETEHSGKVEVKTLSDFYGNS
jgi:phage terminase small subunit